MAEVENEILEKRDKEGITQFVTIGNISQLIALAIAIIYVYGFIIVTTYWGSFGIKDYDYFHTQYIFSGTVLLLVLGVFYLSVGIKIIDLNQDVEYFQKMFRDNDANGTYWGICAFLYPFTELGLYIAVATIICSSFLFHIPNTEHIKLSFLIPGVAVLIHYSLPSTRKVSGAAGKLFLPLMGLFNLITFLAFYYVVDGIMLDFMNCIFAGCFIVIVFAELNNYIAKANQSFKRKVYAFFAIFIFVLSSSYFGRNLYGYVKSSVGGGEPEQVRVVVDELNTPLAIKRLLNITETLSSKVNLIAQTDSVVYLGYPIDDHAQEYKTIIGIDRKLIRAIISNDLSVIK